MPRAKAEDGDLIFCFNVRLENRRNKKKKNGRRWGKKRREREKRERGWIKTARGRKWKKRWRWNSQDGKEYMKMKMGWMLHFSSPLAYIITDHHVLGKQTGRETHTQDGKQWKDSATSNKKKRKWLIPTQKWRCIKRAIRACCTALRSVTGHVQNKNKTLLARANTSPATLKESIEDGLYLCFLLQLTSRVTHNHSRPPDQSSVENNAPRSLPCCCWCCCCRWSLCAGAICKEKERERERERESFAI